MALESPVDALVGHHSGLIGPAMGSRLRMEAAQRLNRAVHAALVGAVEGGDAASVLLTAQAPYP